jgi:hypothetical protein
VRYLLLVYESPGSVIAPGERHREDCAYASRLRSSGRQIDHETVQCEDGSVTEVWGEIVAVARPRSGPAGRKLASAWLVEARDLNEAIRLAQGIPSAGAGTIEVHRLAASPSPAALAPSRPWRHP